MALPKVFANVSELDTPDLDSNFNALGAISLIPCTASGTNTIALTPAANTPTISAYTNNSPAFTFIAAATSSGAITININGVGAKNLYKNAGANAAGSGDLISGSTYIIVYNSALNASAGGFIVLNVTTSAAPTVQRFTSGTGATYTAPAGVARQRVRMWAGGGGGGAQLTNTGSTGGTTSFQVNSTGTAWTCIGGTGGLPGTGASGGPGGAGGTGGTDGSTGTKTVRMPGGTGGGNTGATASAPSPGGPAAMMGLFGATVGVSATPSAAPANSGGGGAGAWAGASNAGRGGGGGEFVEFWVSGMTTATYTVGAFGAGGTAGTQAGGDGAAGLIIVEEFYF